MTKNKKVKSAVAQMQQLAKISRSARDVRAMVGFNTIEALHNELMVRGVHSDLAAEAAAAAKITLPVKMHENYPDEFDSIINSIASLISSHYAAYTERFGAPTSDKVLLHVVAKMEFDLTL